MHLFTNFLTPSLLILSRVAAAATTTTSSAAAATATARANCLNITQLNSDYDKFTTALNNWNGSLGGALPVQNAQQQVESDWRVILQCRQTYVPGYAEYASWVDYCNGTFAPTVRKFVAAFNNKQKNFQSSGLGGTSKDTLKNYKNYTLTYRDKVVPPIQDSQLKSRANATLVLIANSFNNDLNGPIPPFSPPD